MAPPYQTVEARLWASVVKGPSCWLWTGHTHNGYGALVAGRDSRWGKPRSGLLAHRVSYILTFGEPPADMVVHHTCRNQRCVNPAHLELMTRAAHKAEHPEIVSVFKTHCRKGHLYTPENEYWTTLHNGRRYRECRQCAIQRMRERRRRAKSS